MALALIVDLLRLLRLTFRSHARLAAENLFLRKQLACYVERKVRPKGADNASRVALVLLSRFVAWRELLTILRPDTVVSQNWIDDAVTWTSAVIPLHLLVAALFGWLERQQRDVIDFLREDNARCNSTEQAKRIPNGHYFPSRTLALKQFLQRNAVIEAHHQTRSIIRRVDEAIRGDDIRVVNFHPERQLSIHPLMLTGLIHHPTLIAFHGNHRISREIPERASQSAPPHLARLTLAESFLEIQISPSQSRCHA
jgi:hypothetical protein